MGFLTAEGQTYSKGLENIVAAISAISAIDGEEGVLIYRGIDIEQLAKYSTFGESSYLLLFGDLPNKRELEHFCADLFGSRELPEKVAECLKTLPPDPHPMDILKLVVAHMGLYDPDKNRMDRKAKIRKAIRIIAQLPTIVAYYHRSRQGKEFIPPNPELDHAANFLYMLTGKEPDKEDAKIFDTALVLHLDHGLNASTFAGLVTASTLSDMHSAIVSAIGTLKGPLHGGANERVLKMLDEIGRPENAEKFIMESLKEKRKIMGFGHRVYKTMDPRAKILKEHAIKLSDKYKDRRLIDIALKVEEVMIREVSKKGIYPNVDFYSGIVYKFLGIPTDLYTPVFAIARVVGWTAHILEYTEANRIFRPRILYNGPIDKEYIPLEQRP